MSDRILDLGREQIGKAQSTGRELVERSLRMHCAAYLAAAKARLLGDVIVEMKDSRDAITADLGAEQKARRELSEQVQSGIKALAHTQHRLAAESAEKERLQAEFVQAQRMEAVGALAGGVAHDLRNYLQVINSGLGDALAEVRSPPVRQGLEDAREAARLAAELAGNLLDLSRRRELIRRPTSINALAQRAGRMLEPGVHDGIELRYALAPGDPIAEVDGDQVVQALLNLGLNARDAIGQRQGAITFATGTGEVREIPPAAAGRARPGHFAWIQVSDTGSGIPSSALPKIFEPFFSTKEPGKGTGLGLSMVHACAASHGGWVEVSTEVGRGTALRMYFPLPGSAGSGPEKVAAAARGTVVVADDQELIRRSLGRIVSELGFAVVLAENGAAALAQAEAHRDRLVAVVTDLRMPEMDGQGLLGALRARGFEVPVVAVSGRIDLAPAEKEKFDAVIAKPFEAKNLQDTLSRLVRGKK